MRRFFNRFRKTDTIPETEVNSEVSYIEDEEEEEQNNLEDLFDSPGAAATIQLNKETIEQIQKARKELQDDIDRILSEQKPAQ